LILKVSVEGNTTNQDPRAKVSLKPWLWNLQQGELTVTKESCLLVFQTWHLALAVPDALIIAFWIVAVCSHNSLCPISTGLYSRIICLAGAAKIE